MILLRLISWPYFRRHILRTLLTTAGIVLGVAVFVGMHTANESVLYAFNHTVDRIAGKTELQVSAGETGFNEEVLETVQGSPAVRVAVPVIEAVVDSRIAGQGSLLVLGTDLTGDRSLRDYDLESGDEAVIDDPLVFLAQPDSIIVTKEFAEKNGLPVNGTLTLGTALGDRRFTVRGIMHGGKPWMTSFDNPFVQAAGRAIEKGFGRTPIFTREGGSIPVVSTFQEELGLPSVLFGVGLPDENAHAPNEKLDVSNFHNGIIASAFLYDEIATLDSLSSR